MLVEGGRCIERVSVDDLGRPSRVDVGDAPAPESSSIKRT